MSRILIILGDKDLEEENIRIYLDDPLSTENTTFVYDKSDGSIDVIAKKNVYHGITNVPQDVKDALAQYSY